MATSDGTIRRGIASDERGVILVIGIVAGGALVAGLYFMVSVGDAVVWRQGVQDAADAAAFHNAVLQARGMNVIVVLNMVMAVVMAILVSFRMLEMIVFIGLVLAGIGCAIPPGLTCGLVPRIAQFQAKLLKKDKPLSERIAKICAAINVAEKATATVVPPIAMMVSSLETMADYPGVAFAVSPSLVPPMLASMQKVDVAKTTSKVAVVKQVLKGDIKDKITDCFKRRPSRTTPPKPDPKPLGERVSNFSQARWKDISQQRMGIVFSLPVMDDRVQRLCAEASRYQDAALVSLFGGHLPSDGLAIVRNSIVSEAKARIVQAAPSLFCMPATAGLNSGGDMLRDQMQREVQSRCDQASKNFQKKPKAEREKDPFYKGPAIFADSEFDMDKCRNETKREQEERQREAYKKQDQARAALDTIMKCVKPAKVWEMSRNGNLFMQSFSWGLRPMPRTYMLPYVGRVTTPSATFIRAQAEMFFDCAGGWYESCDGNAMWETKWRARLRRAAPFHRMAGDAAALIIASGISHGLQRWFGDVAAKHLPGVGTDLKYGNITNYPRDWLQEELYTRNPLSSATNGVTEIH